MNDLMKNFSEATNLDANLEMMTAPIFKEMDEHDVKHPTTDEIKEFCLDIYQSKFTEEEIQQMIDWNKSELGKKSRALAQTIFNTAGMWMQNEIKNRNQDKV